MQRRVPVCASFKTCLQLAVTNASAPFQHPAGQVWCSEDAWNSNVQDTIAYLTAREPALASAAAVAAAVSASTAGPASGGGACMGVAAWPATGAGAAGSGDGPGWESVAATTMGPHKLRVRPHINR